jgi:hypothetical protein
MRGQRLDQRTREERDDGEHDAERVPGDRDAPPAPVALEPGDEERRVEDGGRRQEDARAEDPAPELGLGLVGEVVERKMSRFQRTSVAVIHANARVVATREPRQKVDTPIRWFAIAAASGTSQS